MDVIANTAIIFHVVLLMCITGSHGAGDPSETLTPLVAWGAGVCSARYIEPSSATQQSPLGTWYCVCMYVCVWCTIKGVQRMFSSSDNQHRPMRARAHESKRRPK